ncbi:MAG: hypothetical protein M1565_03805, partial [Actinobacteria bacterium]|nr:hypothetical protein [Actinomycetota bacterium]
MKKLLIALAIIVVTAAVFVVPSLMPSEKGVREEIHIEGSPAGASGGMSSGEGQEAPGGEAGAGGLPDVQLQTEGSASVASPTPAFDGPTPTPISLSGRERQAGALVFLNPSEVIPESEVGITGEGFLPREKVSIGLAAANQEKTKQLGVALTDKNGYLAGVSFPVTKRFLPGSYRVRVEGQKSGQVAEAVLRVVSGGPWAEPATYSGRPHTPVDISGGGFRPGETVSVHFDSLAAESVAAARADVYGNVSLRAVPVPTDAGAGEHAFILYGEDSGTPVRVPFSVLGFNPWVALSSYSPQAERELGFAGHDFAPGERIFVYLNDTKGRPVAVVRADGKGRFVAARGFVIPGSA